MAHGGDGTNQERLRAHFIGQARGCRQLGSPFTALVCELLAERLDRTSAFGRRMFDWPGEPRADALSLRAAGALNALARSGRDLALRAAYPPNETQAEPLWQALSAAIAGHDAFLTSYLDSPPQTNEVKRCAVLLGGALVIARESGLPLDLIEIGSSAGLNLGFERYRYELGSAEWGSADAPVTIRSQWRGTLPPLDAPLAVAARRACDLNPLDPSRREDRERVLSYIWPDQADRLSTTEAAFDAAAAAPWRVEREDAATWVEARLSETSPTSRARVLMHTIMWQYLPEPTKQRITAAMMQAGAAAMAERPLYWLRMEADGDSAAVTLGKWPGGAERELGRADYHGRWVEWH
ncbi:DUF2332 family protein [Bosea caraganae]|uniref:DUF2332 family protein n=1 Tax=Bosea caraganae TaxID=2763117 RepID=A0A370L5Y1_9HYPH|nr:DUF2332 family protein [Bosea caraganae]RDJ23237.1 DUF2332 family protein [Bosea caraganae]RDJ24649.1 DUF2332 family protein [Bosea caraganae]